MLSMARLSLDNDSTSVEDARTHLIEVTKVFRLLANPLMQLATTASIELLRAQAQSLLGTETLLRQAEDYHQAATLWPHLLPACGELRMALGAYRDASSAAANRLMDHAGRTRALGLLPVERWRTFANDSTVEALAAVLDGLLFDAPAPHFTADGMLDAVEEGLRVSGTRLPPPRPTIEDDPPAATPSPDTELRDLVAVAEDLLAGRDQVTVAALLRQAGGWLAGRRVLSQLVSIHHREELPYRLTWADGLRVDADSTLSWTTDGWFGRTPATEWSARG